jgi:hypothetical protein
MVNVAHARVDDCMLLECFPAASCIGCYNYVQCQAGPSALTAAVSTATAALWHFNFLELKGKWRKHHKPHAQWAAVRRTFKQRQWGHRGSAARGRGWPSPGAEAGGPLPPDTAGPSDTADDGNDDVAPSPVPAGRSGATEKLGAANLRLQAVLLRPRAIPDAQLGFIRWRPSPSTYFRLAGRASRR